MPPEKRIASDVIRMVSYRMLQLHQYVWFGSCLERISGMPTLLDLTTRTCKVFKRSKSTRLCLKRLWVWIDSPCSRHLYISTSTNASERLCKIISYFFCFLKQCFVLQIPLTIQNCSTLFRKDLKICGLHLWWTNRQGDLIPDICHERHEYIRVNFFWPV